MEEFKQIDATEAKTLMQDKNLIIIDIRDSQAYNDGHIDGAIVLTDQTIDTFLKTTDRKKPVLCYCYHGMSSQNAASFLVENGFETVYSLIGGFEDWRLNNPIVSGS